MVRFVAGAVCAMFLAMPPAAQAHPCCYSPSDASALSLLPVAVSIAAPVVLISAGAALTVVAVEASATGTVWVVESASDGTRASVELSGAASVGVGASLVVTAVASGWVLSAAGEAVAFIPNELGRALLYNERLTR